MKIYGGMLVKNEAKKWLPRVCTIMQQICDKVIVLDDASTDNTIDVCLGFGFEVHRSDLSWWSVDELKQRRRLFNYLHSEAQVNDIILILDADEIMFGSTDQIRNKLKSIPLDYKAFGFKLYDMWSDTQYRNDMYWQAHTHLWPMAIRKTGDIPKWVASSLHCGRFPFNLCHNVCDTNVKIKHMGWSNPVLRAEKYDRYMLADPNGECGNIEQYKSILDENPCLEVF